MRIKPLNKKKATRRKHSFSHGIVHVEHRQRKAGRLPQLNNALRRR